MVSLLLFATITLVFSSMLIAAMVLCVLVGPFTSAKDTFIGLVLLFLVVPVQLIGAFHLNEMRVNYCPPLEPIAETEL